eukprot:3449206-Amphidinium_carterae.1
MRRHRMQTMAFKPKVVTTDNGDGRKRKHKVCKTQAGILHPKYPQLFVNERSAKEEGSPLLSTIASMGKAGFMARSLKRHKSSFGHNSQELNRQNKKQKSTCILGEVSQRLVQQQAWQPSLAIRTSPILHKPCKRSDVSNIVLWCLHLQERQDWVQARDTLEAQAASGCALGSIVLESTESLWCPTSMSGLGAGNFGHQRGQKEHQLLLLSHHLSC